MKSALLKMMSFIRALGNASVRLFLWCIVVIFTVLILSQIAFWTALIWIETKSGQNYIEALLGSELKGSGYRVDIDGLSYLMPTHLYLGNITIYQGDEEFFSMDGVSLNIGVFPLEDKNLLLSLNIDALTLSPVTDAPPATIAEATRISPVIVAPMELPDLYFTSIDVNDIAIKKLILKDKAGGSDIVLSPSLTGHIKLSGARVDFNISLIDNMGAGPSFMPREMRIDGNYHASDAALSLKMLEVIALDYSVIADGAAIFKMGEVFDFNVKANSSLIDGLSPVQMDLSLENIDSLPANIILNGEYKTHKIALKALLTAQGDDINLKDLSVKLPGFMASGAASYQMSHAIARGQIKGRLDSLTPYQSFIGGEHDLASLNFTLGLDGGESGQVAGIKASSAKYENAEIGFSLSDLVLDAVLTPQEITLNSFSAHDRAGGDMKLSGVMGLGDLSIDMALKANNIHALKGGFADGVLDLDLSVKGTPDQYFLRGAIMPQKINIRLPEHFNSEIPTLNVVETGQESNLSGQDFAKSVMVDITLDAPSQIFVRGWGLDAEFGGKVTIKGALDDAQYDGALKILRGRYNDFGKNFKIPRGSLIFNGSVPPYPRLDILAQTKAGDIMAQIEITGNAQKPELGFSSKPALPEDEVLSHILFGKKMNNISAFQAVKLAQTLARISGNGGGALSSFDPVDTLRSGVGLDDLRVETDESGGASVGAGKYLSENVYLEFEAGSEDGSGGATIEVEMTPNITIESEIGQDAQGGGGVFWKYDY